MELSSVLCGNLDGWDGGSRRRENTYTCSWFTLLDSRNQHNIVKQLFLPPTPERCYLQKQSHSEVMGIRSSCEFGKEHTIQPITLPFAHATLDPCHVPCSVQEYWSGLPFPTPGDHPYPETEHASPVFPVLAGGFFTTEPSGSHIL